MCRRLLWPAPKQHQVPRMCRPCLPWVLMGPKVETSTETCRESSSKISHSQGHMWWKPPFLQKPKMERFRNNQVKCPLSCHICGWQHLRLLRRMRYWAPRSWKASGHSKLWKTPGWTSARNSLLPLATGRKKAPSLFAYMVMLHHTVSVMAWWCLAWGAFFVSSQSIWAKCLCWQPQKQWLHQRCGLMFGMFCTGAWKPWLGEGCQRKVWMVKSCHQICLLKQERPFKEEWFSASLETWNGTTKNLTFQGTTSPIHVAGAGLTRALACTVAFLLCLNVFIFLTCLPTLTCCFVYPPRTDMPWNDFRSTALWRKSLLTPEELMAAFNHKIFTVSGVNPLALCLDTLHTLDLGVSCHIVGNLLWELIEEMNEKIQKTYESEGIPAMDRLHAISHSDLRKKAQEYPILKHQKGARVRKFIPVACKLAGEKRDDSDHGKHRHELLLALKEMYELLGKEGFKWQTQEHAQFQAACEKCMKHYQWLAKEAVSRKEFLWSVVQKHHMSQHLVEQSKFISPRHFHTYGGEGFMKTMKKLAGACLNGTPAHKVPQAIVVKYRFFWHLMLSGLIEEEWKRSLWT